VCVCVIVIVVVVVIVVLVVCPALSIQVTHLFSHKILGAFVAASGDTP